MIQEFCCGFFLGKPEVVIGDQWCTLGLHDGIQFVV